MVCKTWVLQIASLRQAICPCHTTLVSGFWVCCESVTLRLNLLSPHEMVFCLDFITNSSVRASLNLKAKLLFFFTAHAFSSRNEVSDDLISPLLQLVLVLSLISASTCKILQKVREMRLYI